MGNTGEVRGGRKRPGRGVCRGGGAPIGVVTWK